MAKFLFSASYTQAGIQGAVREGFGSREAYIKGLVESAGGRMEVFYWAYGKDDVIVVIDAEPASAIAISMAINQSGAVKLTTTPLLTSAEMDQARAKLPQYRAPGT